MSGQIDHLIQSLRKRCYRSNGRQFVGANDVAVRYVMDGNEQYLYPNVLLAASLFQEKNVNTDSLYPQRADQRDDVEQLASLSLVSLGALAQIASDMRAQMDAAEARGDVNTARFIEKSILSAQNMLLLASDRFPHLTSLLPALDSRGSQPLPLLPAIKNDDRDEPSVAYRDVHYASVWRDNLLSQIQSMCAYMGNYEIVKGTNAARSAARRNFDSIADWQDACHRRDQLYNSRDADEIYAQREQVVDDIDQNRHVLSGVGRLVRRKWTENEARGVGGRRWDRSQEYEMDDADEISRLFLAFPGCFLYKRFPVDTRLRNAPLYPGVERNRAVFVSVDKPTLIERTNEVLPAGYYRLDRTIFLTLQDTNGRTIAVRSDYREADGRLRYAERHYSEPNFADPDAAPARIYHAGNASLFMALQRDSDRHLLGFWLGCMAKNANIGQPEYAIQYNSRVGKLPDCRVRCAGAAVERIVIDEVPRRMLYSRGRTLPPHRVVRLVLSTDSRYGDAKYGEIRNGLLVDFFCAAQPGPRCPPSLPHAAADFEPVAGVGLFLFFYALVYYSKYSPASLNLYVRRWSTRDASSSQIFAESTIAHYYNKHFGLQFVPTKSALRGGNHLHDKSQVRAQIAKEIGLDYMRQEYAETFRRPPLPLDALLDKHPEFCHFYTLLRDAQASDGTVDLRKLTEAPLFRSDFNWPPDEREEATMAQDNPEIEVSHGRMFRFYPHLAELEMRVVEQFLGFVDRLEKTRQLEPETASRLRSRYQSTLVPDNDALQRFADTVEQRARQEFRVAFLQNVRNNPDDWEREWERADNEQAKALRTKHANQMIAIERNRASQIAWDESVDEQSIDR